MTEMHDTRQDAEGGRKTEHTEAVLQELKTLLGYLVKHNQEHAAEITDLAARARELGKGDAYDHLARGVDLLNESNKSLRAALATLEGHHVSG
jgi:hypothetical protein